MPIAFTHDKDCELIHARADGWTDCFCYKRAGELVRKMPKWIQRLYLWLMRTEI